MQPDLYYRILEIEPGASKDDVKQAYKDLAKVWHPDRFSNDLRLQQKAEEKLKQINAAYEFLKSYKPQDVQNQSYKPQDVQSSTESPQKRQEQPTVILPNCEKLEKLLKLGNLKEADQETKQLLLELAKRGKDRWLRPEDVKGFAAQALSAIDQPWIKHSNGRFGFSAQRRIWHKLGCKSSASTFTQTVSENQFGQTVRWRVGNMWLSPWDSFSYDSQAPEGNLPREYIFTLSGWQSYSKGWVGQLLWRFDEILLKL